MYAKLGVKANLNIRWMLRRDLEASLRIDADAFQYPWSEDDFFDCLRQRNCVGMVAEVGGQVVGYMVYQLSKTRIDLLSFAVDPACQRKGIGRAMATKLIGKLTAGRRNRIIADVWERNLDAQLFFQVMGFRAIDTLPTKLSSLDDCEYRFRYNLPVPAAKEACCADSR